MKKIEAVLGVSTFDAVRELLISRGCQEIIVSEVSSAALNGGRTLRYRGVEYSSDAPRLKLETVVADEDAMPVAHAILSVSQSQDNSNSAVSVCELESVFSIGITKLEPRTNSPKSPDTERASNLRAESTPYLRAG